MLRLVGLMMFACVPFVADPALAQSNSQDEQSWATARSVGTLAAYETYLQDHKDGRYAGLAFRCTVEMALMQQGHQCSANRVGPGPLGPVRSQIGTFAVTLR